MRARPCLTLPLAAATLVLATPGRPLLSAPDPFAENVRTTPPRTPEDQQRGFTLPPGFEIRLVAAEPEIHKPINMAFDGRGRLWITETLEYPFPAPPDKPGRDAIKILEDTDGDGRADKITTFADGLNIPTGLLPLPDGAIAWSIPNVWRFWDTDGDGRAERREILFGPLGWERDTHGMSSTFRRGFDGWMYVTHGYNNISTIRGRDGSAFTLKSGNIYRVRIDGSRAEPFTWGQVNPFGGAFDPLGNLFVADCHSAPIYQLLHGSTYPHFGDLYDGLGFGPALMTHSHGSTAIAGLVYYADDLWPAEYRDNIFVGNPVTSRVNRDRLEYTGASPRAVEQPDFLSGDDPWFRPVDLQLGPDGALYVADFYNRIIGHYEVSLGHPGRDRERGRIWRITYKGSQHKPVDVAGAPVTAVARELGSPNLTRRFLATNALADRGGTETVAAMRRLLAPGARASLPAATHALWVLERLHALDVSTLRALARHRAPEMRGHVMRVLAETASYAAAHWELALAGLGDASPLVRRAAAEALRSHPTYADVQPLLRALEKTPALDTHLRHVVRLALKEALALTGNLWRFAQEPPATFAHQAVAEIALGITTAEAGAYALAQVREKGFEGKLRLRLAQHAAGYGPPEDQAALVAAMQASSGGTVASDLTDLFAVGDGISRAGRIPGPAMTGWSAAIAAKGLGTVSAACADAGACNALLESLAGVIRHVKLQEAAAPLLARVSQTGVTLETKAAIVRAARAAAPTEARIVLAPVVEDTRLPPEIREEAAAVLAAPDVGVHVGVHVDVRWRKMLDGALQRAPSRDQLQIARALITSEEGALLLIAFVEGGKVPARVLYVPSVKNRLGAINRPEIARALERWKAAASDLRPELDALIAKRFSGVKGVAGRATAGLAVFDKTCAACHRLAGHGGVVGPQLDGVGARGTERLLEDVLDPNRNVDIAFHMLDVSLKDGEIVSGLPRREDASVLVLAGVNGAEVAVPKRDIKERHDSGRSPMPDNFGDLLTDQDLGDLFAYLMKGAQVRN